MFMGWVDKGLDGTKVVEYVFFGLSRFFLYLSFYYHYHAAFGDIDGHLLFLQWLVVVTSYYLLPLNHRTTYHLPSTRRPTPHRAGHNTHRTLRRRGAIYIHTPSPPTSFRPSQHCLLLYIYIYTLFISFVFLSCPKMWVRGWGPGVTFFFLSALSEVALLSVQCVTKNPCHEFPLGAGIEVGRAGMGWDCISSGGVGGGCEGDEL